MSEDQSGKAQVEMEYLMEEQRTSRQKQAWDTRQKIYRSAVELFKRRPYDEVKIADICEQAGVSVGVFYHYFPSKGHLFNESYLHFEKELRQYLKSLDTTPLITIERVIEKYLEAIIANGPAYRSVFLRNQLEIKDSSPLRNIMRSILAECVEQAVEQGFLSGDPLEITNLLIRSTRGHTFDWAMNDGAFSLPQEGQRITGIILAHYRTDREKAR